MNRIRMKFLAMILGLTVASVSSAVLIRWYANLVNAPGPVTVYTGKGALGSVVLGSIAVTSGPNGTVNLWDSPTGTTYTVTGNPAPVELGSFSVPVALSQTTSGRVLSFGGEGSGSGMFFQYGLVVDSGTSTLTATFLYQPQ